MLVLMNGAAIILLGLVAYGTLHIHNDVLQAWQWLARDPVLWQLPCNTDALTLAG